MWEVEKLVKLFYRLHEKSLFMTLIYLLTHGAEHFLEAPNSAATQELPSILWTPKVQYRIHKSPPLLPILSHINLIHTIRSYLRSILILSTHLRLSLPSGLFPSGFTTTILYAFLFSPIHTTCPRPSHIS
jgi:hypothetical protein